MRRVLLFLSLTVAGISVVTAADVPRPKSIVIGRDGSLATESPATPAVTTSAEVGVDPTAPLSIEEVAAANGEEPAPEQPTVIVQQVDMQPVVQAMQLMIDQQKLALDAMEKSRATSQAASKASAEVMAAKMSQLEEALNAQREHEVAQQANNESTLRRMNRTVIGVATAFAGTGFLVMVLTAWFFMRTMNRVAEINSDLQSQLLALPHAPANLVGNGASEPGNQRLLGALEELEKRISELEHTSLSASAASSISDVEILTSTGNPMDKLVGENVVVDAEDDVPSVSALMAKGQTLLNLDDAEEALVCFNSVLAREPRNSEALLKKGTALERLRRVQEALDAYDAALEEDDTLTMAYLAKGGICNRLERYAEALECYERALRVQQQGAA